MGNRVRCGKCRRKWSLCCCCDAQVDSARAFMCKSCKNFKDNEKVKLWHKRHGQARKIVLKIP